MTLWGDEGQYGGQTLSCPLKPQPTRIWYLLPLLGSFNTIFLILKATINPIKACSLGNNIVPMFVS